MPKRSAGLLVYRHAARGLELLLVHPGGPLWAKRDDGAWSFPKGEYAEDEEPLAVARREWEEETGQPAPDGPFTALEPVRQAGGKVVTLWAAEGDIDPATLRSNAFTMEWPPRSGRRAEFPEVDRAGWFTPEEARAKLLPSQASFVDQLLRLPGLIR